MVLGERVGSFLPTSYGVAERYKLPQWSQGRFPARPELLEHFIAKETRTNVWYITTSLYYRSRPLRPIYILRHQ